MAVRRTWECREARRCVRAIVLYHHSRAKNGLRWSHEARTSRSKLAHMPDSGQAYPLYQHHHVRTTPRSGRNPITWMFPILKTAQRPHQQH